MQLELLNARPRALLITALLLSAAGCDGGPSGSIDLGLDAGAEAADLGRVDLGAALDSGQALDLSAFDLGEADLGTADLGETDQGPVDLGPSDLGSADQGGFDQGPGDLGPPDLGSADSGIRDGGSGGVIDVFIFVQNNCDVITSPASITVPMGTGFTVNWIHTAGSSSNVDVDKIDPFNAVPIIIGLEPGSSYHDTIREWCGSLFSGTFSFRITGCFDPHHLNVDCGG